MSRQQCVVFDLRVTQTHQDRGIPRYLRNVLKALFVECSHKRFYFLLDKTLPLPFFYKEFEEKGSFFFSEEGSSLFSDKRIHSYFVCSFPGQVNQFNFFESLFPPFLYGHAPYIFGIVWDLIPLIFSEHYINVDNKGMYLPAYAAMQKADHLFVISDSVAHDVNKMLNIPMTQITTIYGGVCENISINFNKNSIEEERSDFTFGSLHKKEYFIYVSGFEWRKNLPRMIEAYRLFSEACGGTPAFPLVVVGTLNDEARELLVEQVLDNKMSPNKDIIFTGYVPDGDLVRLMKNARGLIFPSFYEGLGLPILESYTCRLPVIASGTSSMPELVHSDCLFNPYDIQDMANKVYEFAFSEPLRQKSLDHGKIVLSKMGWQKAASLIAPYLNGQARSNVQTFLKSASQAVPIFSILPPHPSGIAEYTFDMFKNAPFEVHFFSQFPSFDSAQGNDKPLKSFHPHLFGLFKKHYDYRKAVFILGNSDHHSCTLSSLLEDSTLVDIEKYIYLHDVKIINLWYAYFKNDIEKLKPFLQKFYPEKKSELALCETREDILEKVPICGLRPLIHSTSIKKIFVNSSAARDLVVEELKSLSMPPCEILFLPIIEENYSPPNKAASLETTIGSFGRVDGKKHPEILLEACRILNKRIPLKLLFAGYEVAQSVFAETVKLPEFVELVDSPSNKELIQLMGQVDVAVQLRWPTHGESSGVVNQLLDLNKPVIATDLGSFQDYEGLVKLTRVGITPQELAQVLEETIEHKNEISRDVALEKARFSLPSFFKRFQEALDL